MVRWIMARYLFIDSLQHVGIYRREDRRQAATAVTTERRRAERRQHVGISDELRRLCVAVVIFPDCPNIAVAVATCKERSW